MQVTTLQETKTMMFTDYDAILYYLKEQAPKDLIHVEIDLQKSDHTDDSGEVDLDYYVVTVVY